MFVDFFLHLKSSGLPVSTREFLDFLAGLKQQVCAYSVENFYYWSRMALVKDEGLYDRFDRAFAVFFKGLAESGADLNALPEAWLRALGQRFLSDEEKLHIEKMGWDKLMETLRQRLEEQQERHQGGSKWIGTRGTSPFGNSGYHPEGIRIGEESAGHHTAVKVWAKREFRNLDNQAALGVRNIQVALRRLRHFAREGAAEELDLPGTIEATARNAGWLDLKMRPERHNAVRVLLFLDSGGSMDSHVRLCESLFTACHSEFKHLQYFYFHNCVYESVWRDNTRRFEERVVVNDLLHTYDTAYKLIIVGDAAMSPYEILYSNGSVEHVNSEPGSVWLQRLLKQWPSAVWLNPMPEHLWQYTQSVGMIQRLMDRRMYPLTVQGVTDAIARLSG